LPSRSLGEGWTSTPVRDLSRPISPEESQHHLEQSFGAQHGVLNQTLLALLHQSEVSTARGDDH
jgi:hypothetical protein